MKIKIIILLLVCVCILTTGCKLALNNTREEKKYEAGNFSQPIGKMPWIMMGIKSDTNEFKIDDVSVQLYYGLYNYDYYDDTYTNYKSHFQSGADEQLIVGIYVCEEEYGTITVVGNVVNDYKDIDNNYFLKEIDEDKAFLGSYGYYIQANGVIEYEHNELITIPKEVFKENNGEIRLNVLVFRIEEDGKYSIAGKGRQEIKYELTEDEKVIITNLKK